MITDLEFLPLVISSLKIFKRIFSWLKRNMNGVAKQDCRILKILRYYFKDYERMSSLFLTYIQTRNAKLIPIPIFPSWHPPSTIHPRDD